MSMQSNSKCCGVVLIVSLSLLFLLSGAIDATTSSAAETWQREWENTKAAAMKEGTVVILASELKADLLRTGFKKEGGVDLEFLTGRSNQLAAKISTERRAGLYTVDAVHMGITSLTSLIKPLGISPFADMLFLPEVTNPKNWLGGKLPWVEPEKSIFNFAASSGPSVVINTNMVNTGEITSILDLLKPKWKGKIVFGDPTMPGGASTNVLALWIKIFGREKGLQIIRQFAAQELIMTRDFRLMLEWIAKGKYPLAVGGSQSLYSGFKKAGAPITYLTLKEPGFLATGPGCLSVFTNSPHPNATKLYVNWLLSKNGATIWKDITGYPSRRLDVSKEGIDPAFILRGDEINVEQDLRKEMQKISADIFKGSLK